ncbi:hypothetical protein ABZ318_35740 [Streptomyces sp. NPDC006197]|uniref:hypothetical protein n=1 Tax=Streptomyces sp. NPDC006197 TaxID=3156685 RepID=UPI0033A3792A
MHPGTSTAETTQHLVSAAETPALCLTSSNAPVTLGKTTASKTEHEPAEDMERLRAFQETRAGKGTEDLTAEQISNIQARIEEMTTRGKTLRERYSHRPEAPTLKPVLEDQQRGQRPERPGPGDGGVSH